MNLAPVDWVILFGLLAIMLAGVLLSRGYMRSVADFLAANRSAGRYLISFSTGLAALGAITIVANLEMNFVAGFSMSWWGMTMSVVVLLTKVTGWVVYRFRQTRCLTLAEFFERRYSRRFRVFAGGLAFFSGLINFGIFPAVGARFFIYFCGLPQAVSLFGLSVATYPLVMLVLLSISLFFVFVGGQVAVMITDFLQGLFVNVVFVVIVVYLLYLVDWTRIFETLAMAPQDASLINPFKTSHVEDFNFWYFLIGVFGVLYGAMSWQGTQAYNASARSAHEAKMAGVLDMFRGFPQGLFMLFVPIVAYTVMRHPDFAQTAAQVQGVLDTVDNDAVVSQVRSPLVLVQLLPVGLMGAFAAVMLAAFISTHDTYLHSWGSILVQDVILPLRKRPFTPKEHIKALRASIVGVAVFIFFFSLFFKQSEYILLFFAITGAIFAGGSGAVIIGGLYWSRGTAAAAWASLITGSGISVAGIILHQFYDDFPINGQMFWALAMGGSAIVYVVVSLVGRREIFDLDRLLHRGIYALASEYKVEAAEPSRGWRMLLVGKEFSRRDKLLYVITYVWTLSWFLLFVVGTVYNLTHEVGDASWIAFWKVFLWIHIVMSAIVIVWFAIGGFRDLRRMLLRLKTIPRDDADDGTVRRPAAMDEEIQ